LKKLAHRVVLRQATSSGQALAETANFWILAIFLDINIAAVASHQQAWSPRFFSSPCADFLPFLFVSGYGGHRDDPTRNNSVTGPCLLQEAGC